MAWHPVSMPFGLSLVRLQRCPVFPRLCILMLYDLRGKCTEAENTKLACFFFSEQEMKEVGEEQWYDGCSETGVDKTCETMLSSWESACCCYTRARPTTRTSWCDDGVWWPGNLDTAQCTGRERMGRIYWLESSGECACLSIMWTCTH
jgi:hypothetical protein